MFTRNWKKAAETGLPIWKHSDGTYFVGSANDLIEAESEDEAALEDWVEIDVEEMEVVELDGATFVWKPATSCWHLEGVGREGNHWETDDYESSGLADAIQDAQDMLGVLEEQQQD